MSGIGIGTSVVPFDYASEVMPSRIRGKVLNAFGFFWCLGSMSTILLARVLINDKNGWRSEFETLFLFKANDIV